MKMLNNIRRQVIKNLKAMLAPHVWRSGYQGTTIFAFAKVNGSDTRSMGKVYNEDLTCLQGFYSDGTFDAVGGGMMCSPFESYCLEDLLAIESWMNKNFSKEIPRTIAEQADHRLHDEWKTASDGWRGGKTFEAWKRKRKKVVDNSGEKV